MSFPILVLVSLSIAVASVLGAVLLSARPRLAVGVGLMGAMALLLVHGLLHFDFYSDDAFITLRYSRHLADGLGPNWNATGRVEGYSTFLWMAVLAGTAKLGADLVTMSRILGFLSIAAAFAVVVLLWRLWSDDEPQSGVAHPVIPAAVLAGLALTDGISFWGFSGMETGFFMAILSGGAYLHMREQRGGRMPWSASVFAAAAMTRPEGLAAAAVTGAFKLDGVWRRDGRRRVLTRALLWGGVFAALYGSYFLWRYSYYGYLFPNTYYAKVERTLIVAEWGATYVTSAGLNYQLLAMFVGSVVLMAAGRLRHDAAYVIAQCAAVLLVIGVQGGDAFGYGRFIVPMLPLLYLVGLSGFAVLLKRAALPRLHATALTAIAFALTGLLLISTSYHPGLESSRENLEDRELLGSWLNEHTPPDYTIAAYAVGAISYYADDRAFLDLFGLNDVVIAHTEVPDFGKGLPAHERYNVDYVLEDVRPEIIVGNDSQERAYTTEELRQLYQMPSKVPARDEMLTDPRLWEDYEVRSLKLEGRWFNFLQRKDSVAELTAPNLR